MAQVAQAVGGMHSGEACEALHRAHQAYLSIPKALQSAQAFAALVEHSHREEASAEPSQRSRSLGGSGAGQEAAVSGAAAASGFKHEDGEGEDDDELEGLQGSEEEGRSRRSRRTPKRSDVVSPGGRVRPAAAEGCIACWVAWRSAADLCTCSCSVWNAYLCTFASCHPRSPPPAAGVWSAHARLRRQACTRLGGCASGPRRHLRVL
jgi:hypothetical protein